MDPLATMSANRRLSSASWARSGATTQPHDQQVADPPARLVVAVEAEDLGRGLVDVVGDHEQGPVVGRDQAAGLDLVADELVPPLPVGRRRGRRA